MRLWFLIYNLVLVVEAQCEDRAGEVASPFMLALGLLTVLISSAVFGAALYLILYARKKVSPVFSVV